MGNGAFLPLGRGRVLGVDIWTSAPQVTRSSGGGNGDPPSTSDATVVARLLSHSHTDHTAGLKPDWAADGPGSRIHCSSAAAVHLNAMFKDGGRLGDRLVIVGPGDRLRMRPRKRRLDDGAGGSDDGDGVLAEVHVLPANHCVGSLMFLVRSPACGTVLHTGDCRFEAAALRGLLAQIPVTAVLGASSPSAQHINTLFLDATYGRSAACAFPSRCAAAATILAAVAAGPAGLLGGRRAQPAGRRGGRGRGPPLPSTWSEVAIAADGVGKEELLAAVAAAARTRARVSPLRAALAATGGLPPRPFAVDEAAEAGVAPLWPGSAAEPVARGGGGRGAVAARVDGALVLEVGADARGSRVLPTSPSVDLPPPDFPYGLLAAVSAVAGVGAVLLKSAAGRAAVGAEWE